MKLQSAICLALFLSLCIISTGKAQEIQAGVDFRLGVPQGEFDQQLDHLGWGIGLNGGYRFPDTPVMLGLDFGFMNFGRDRREEPLSSTIPDLRVEVENSYNLVNGYLLLRFIPSEAAFRPFLDGLVGFNHFYTETVLRERGRPGADDERLRDTNFKDTAFSYGFGGGVQIRLYKIPEDQSAQGRGISPGAVYLSLQSRYILGREAEYLQEGSIEIEDGEAFYDVSRSKTDLLYFEIGVGVSF